MCARRDMNRFFMFLFPDIKTQTKHHIMHVANARRQTRTKNIETHTHYQCTNVPFHVHRIRLCYAKYSLAIVQEHGYHYAYLSHFYASRPVSIRKIDSCYRIVKILSARTSFRKIHFYFGICRAEEILFTENAHENNTVRHCRWKFSHSKISFGSATEITKIITATQNERFSQN